MEPALQGGEPRGGTASAEHGPGSIGIGVGAAGISGGAATPTARISASLHASGSAKRFGGVAIPSTGACEVPASRRIGAVEANYLAKRSRGRAAANSRVAADRFTRRIGAQGRSNMQQSATDSPSVGADAAPPSAGCRGRAHAPDRSACLRTSSGLDIASELLVAWLSFHKHNCHSGSGCMMLSEHTVGLYVLRSYYCGLRYGFTIVSKFEP